jgi:hypothetical protein
MTRFSLFSQADGGVNLIGVFDLVGCAGSNGLMSLADQMLHEVSVSTF